MHSADPKPETAASRLELGPRRLALAFAVYSLFYGAIFWHFGPQFVDDAYITFRYAERISDGKGFTFNDHEAVLGTTTPLWTLLLAACRGLRLPLALSVGALNALAAAALSLALWRFLRRFGWSVLGLLAGPALLVYERWLFVYLMGMETILSVALTIVVMERIAARRHRGIGFLGALAVLARPDGVVIALLGLLSAWAQQRREAKRETLLFALALAPWAVFATAVFGSPIPLSIAAKQAIHPAGFFSLLAGPWLQLWGDAFGRIACALGCVGLAAVIVRWRGAWAAPVWAALYGLGLASARITLFEWYVIPLAAAVWILAALGLGALRDLLAAALERHARQPLARQARRVSTVLQIGVLAAIVAQSSGFWRRHWRAFPPELTAKERLYLSVARDLAPRLPADAKVLVGEAGVFAYALPQCEILDSAGINSPRIHTWRRAETQRAGGSPSDQPPAWVLTVLSEMSPDLVVTLPQFVGGAQLLAHPESAPNYEPLRPPGADWGSLVVLRRKGFELSPATRTSSKSGLSRSNSLSANPKSSPSGYNICSATRS